MVDTIAIDTTPVTGPSYFQEYKDKGATPMAQRGQTHRRQATHILAYSPFAIAHAGQGTPTAAELRVDVTAGRSTKPAYALEEHDDFADAREARTALLVKKYVGKSTKENNARLDILTERIRRLNPRVNEAEVNALATIVDYVEESSLDIEDLENKYGV